MPIDLPQDLMVSVSGVRGRVGDPLTPELVTAISAGFGTFMMRDGGRGPIYVGRDSRVSGPMLSRAVIAGLQSVGVEVVDLGLVPTPTLLLAVERAGACGGLVVTASHNPAEWNALKLVAGDGTFLDADRAQRFFDFLSAEEPHRAAWDEIRPVSEDGEAWSRHLEAILALPDLDLDAIRGRRLKVAIDCVHGAGGPPMAELLEALGCDVTAIGMTPDGHFPRDPEPTAENLADLSELVRESGTDVGFAVDPDVDRLSLVDETGVATGEDLTLALAAAAVLRRTPGPVVTNLSTSQVLDDVAEAFSVTLHRSSVGEVNVANRMKAEGAIVGGEGNGGVILSALHYTRDAPLAAALILHHLAIEGATLSQAVARWPAYSIRKEKITFPREALGDAYRMLEEALPGAALDHTDGLRLTWRKRSAWLHVRPSGTEPVVRLIAEAPSSEAANALLGQASALLDGVA